VIPSQFYTSINFQGLWAFTKKVLFSCGQHNHKNIREIQPVEVVRWSAVSVRVDHQELSST